jgi:hypothetical protein
MSEDPVATMLEKLHRFSTAQLEPEERGVLGALLAPGVRWALDHGAEEEEVQGFGLQVWTPESLAQGLRRALAERDRHVAPDEP